MALIIIADDDPIVSELARGVLEAEGYVVGLARDGRAAFDAIRAKRPDLVLMDCGMPGMSGLDVVRLMRSSPVLHDIPIVMFTGRRGKQDVQIAYFSGVDAYIKKPIDPDELLFLVGDILGRGRKSAARWHG